MDMHPLDRATALEPLSEGLWRGETAPDYMNVVGPFGGVTVACLLNAVLKDPRRTDAPVAITTNYVTGVREGAFEIAVTLERSGKYLQHWSVVQRQQGGVCSTATVVTGRRSETFAHQPAQMPDAPPPDSLPQMTPPDTLSFLKCYDFRFVDGAPQLEAPFESLQAARSLAWMADRPGRPLDWLSLAALSDGFPFRLLTVRGGMAPMGTVSLSTYFLTTEEELAEQGSAPILGRAAGSRFNAHFHDQKVTFWDSKGRVLASGAQVVWFKE
ncbi:MAG: acyl-CoA thioesterase [Rhodobacterales bacterium]|nr:MAG: acyl-CoA thioesterase [Rhodobacterales bacterium]